LLASNKCGTADSLSCRLPLDHSTARQVYEPALWEAAAGGASDNDRKAEVRKPMLAPPFDF
jgi:hypothetical protein